MSVNDLLKKSFLESGIFVQYDLRQAVTVLLLSLVMGLAIFLVYRRFYTGVIYSRTFSMTLVGMTVMTCMVTQAISTNVVISLGMVGALSIVRFRTAIKDPLDLLYIFWAITSGITMGAKMYGLCFAAGLVMFIMVLVFSLRPSDRRIYVAVIHYQGQEAGDEVLRCFGRMRYTVKSKTMRRDKTELAVEVFCRRNDHAFMERILAVPGVEDATLIQYNGEYHG